MENLGGRGRSWVAGWDLSRREACKRKGGTLHPITQRYLRPMRVFPRDQRGCWRPPPSHPQASVWEVLSGFQRQHRHFLMSRTGCPQQGVKRLPTPQTLFRLPVASVILNFLSPAVSYISFLQSILYHPLKLSFLFIYVIVL